MAGVLLESSLTLILVLSVSAQESCNHGFIVAFHHNYTLLGISLDFHCSSFVHFYYFSFPLLLCFLQLSCSALVQFLQLLNF